VRLVAWGDRSGSLRGMGLLDGKIALVAGVANKRSLAWGIARRLAEQGAQLAFTYQGERIEAGVRELAASVGCELCIECDVSSDESIDKAFAELVERAGGLDLMAHSIAFAQAHDLAGRFTDTARDDWRLALDISAYSLVAMTQRAEPLMEARGGGAIVTMTYLGGERAIPGYNVMGVAKAALDASMRYLAADLGPKNIRVNAISAGPVRTLAARGIAGFSQMEGVIAERAPLKRGIDADDVGQAGLYLLSPMASSVTGTVLYVDAGYHAMGL
jgi:enoyl-[acyl-carrier protein] reductase I